MEKNMQSTQCNNFDGSIWALAIHIVYEIKIVLTYTPHDTRHTNTPKSKNMFNEKEEKKIERAAVAEQTKCITVM